MHNLERILPKQLLKHLSSCHTIFLYLYYNLILPYVGEKWQECQISSVDGYERRPTISRNHPFRVVKWLYNIVWFKWSTVKSMSENGSGQDIANNINTNTVFIVDRKQDRFDLYLMRNVGSVRSLFDSHRCSRNYVSLRT